MDIVNQIDSHQHFWQYDAQKHVWMNDKMAVLKQNHMPEDLKGHLNSNNISGCVSVQASQTESENDFLLQLSDTNDFIKGIVGWVDLCNENIEDRLLYYKSFSKIKGFRHVLHDEPQRDFMLKEDFLSGISKLEKFNYTYDLLIFTDQLEYTIEFVKKFPNQKFVIDHIAKPSIANQNLTDWKPFIEELASFENVYCKISGMVTEADWINWKKEDFTIFLDTIVHSFGFDRIMYGSDWPVCQLAASYDQQYNLVKEYFLQFDIANQNKFFSKNVVKFYNL